MGVLEDAIREHLELKRKHGVSDDELRRQEDEALGPARRETPVAEVAEAAAPEPAAETALLDSDHVPEAPPATASDVEPEPIVEEPAPAEPALSESAEVAEETVVHQAPAEETPVEEPPVQETPLIEPEPSSADFAEEAPPEQDRLSSEDRPRRDLDFD